ncbi:HTH_Tnp_Tc3_2 domain-containing protein [Trichonephila clavipes]|nr:HTH_Tnp_Tc3_2 domain-containing protein [Trichonephila clavipes]
MGYQLSHCSTTIFDLSRKIVLRVNSLDASTTNFTVVYGLYTNTDHDKSWKKAGWTNRRIAHHNGRSVAAIRRCWQERTNNGRFQHHDGSGGSRATADREDRLIVGSVVTVPDSSLSIIRRPTYSRVSTMTIHRQLIENEIYIRTDRYATYHSHLHIIELDYIGAWLDQDMMGRGLHLPGNVNDLARQLKQILRGIQQETNRVIYNSMPRRVAVCIQARGGSTPY